jgi:hypothetical protein
MWEDIVSKHLEPHAGQEKFTFLYIAISAAALTCATAYSQMAGLGGLQRLLLLIGSVFVAWAIVFCFLEVRRIGRKAPVKAAEFYRTRTATIEPATGEPYPHHEYRAESPGLDQGQLTSQLSGTTPFVDRFLPKEKEQNTR